MDTDIDSRLETFAPKAIRYIKLGQGGAWAEEALATETIPFGYHPVSHDACEAKRWDSVRDDLVGTGKKGSGATQALRQVREFYELGPDTLWVTIAAGHLWWCFAAGPVVPVQSENPLAPSRYRPTRAGWRNTSLAGEPLTTLSLSSSLTRTANYRMTICEVERSDYLVRRIRSLPDPLHAQAMALQAKVRQLTEGMIAQLHWQDLESLTDLIFARDGWRRVGVLGGDQPDVDLVLEHATTRQRAWVQVKTKAKQADLADNLERFEQQGTCDRFYFICGHPSGPLTIPDDPHVQLWAKVTLADAAIDAGLFGWLVDRTR